MPAGATAGMVSAVAPSTEPVALTSVAAHLRFWLVVVVGLGLDLWTKEWAVHTYDYGAEPVEVIPYLLQFQTLYNDGALFGFGKGLTRLFLVASVLALALVLWMFAQSSPRRWIMQLALGAIFAGALGNLYDRMFINLVRHGAMTPNGQVMGYFEKSTSADGAQIILTRYPAGERPVRLIVPSEREAELRPVLGYVRDFIKIPTTFFGRELWPWVFNIADALLVCGVSVLAFRLLTDPVTPRAAAPSSGASSEVAARNV